MTFTLTHSTEITIPVLPNFDITLAVGYEKQEDLMAFVEEISKYTYPSDPTRLLVLYEQLAKKFSVSCDVRVVGQWYNWKILLLRFAMFLWRKVANLRTVEDYIQVAGINRND